MAFFDANGSLVMGLQKRAFRFTTKATAACDLATPLVDQSTRDVGVIWAASGAEDAERTSADDWGFWLEKVGVVMATTTLHA